MEVEDSGIKFRTFLATQIISFDRHSRNRPMFEFSCGRSSPLVEPTKAAKSASETRDRTQQLAQPKKVHNSYEANREVMISSGIDL